MDGESSVAEQRRDGGGGAGAALVVPDWIEAEDARTLREALRADGIRRDGDLTVGAYVVRVGPPAAVAEVRHIGGAPVGVVAVAVESNLQRAAAEAWARNAAEYISGAERRAAVCCDRARWLADAGVYFGQYVGRLARLPDSPASQRLARWLAACGARWRSKLSVLAAEIAFQADQLHAAGRTDTRPASSPWQRELNAAVGSVAELAGARGLLARASEMVASTEGALVGPLAVLDARLAEERDRQNGLLQRAAVMISVAVSLSAFTALGGVLTGGPGPWPVRWAVMLTGAAAMAPLVTLMLVAVAARTRRGPRPRSDDLDRVEQELLVLSEGCLLPLGDALRGDVVRLQETLVDREDDAVAREQLVALELRAEKHFLCAFSLLEREWLGIVAMRARHLAEGASAPADVLRWLSKWARASEILSMMFVDLEPSALPLPNIAATLWLKGQVLNVSGAPYDEPAMVECLHLLIVDALQLPPSRVHAALARLREDANELLGMPHDADPFDALADGDEHDLFRRVRQVDVSEVLAKFAWLRPSAFLAGAPR